MYSEVAKKDPARQTHALNMIGESSRKVIDAMSDIVWTINSDNDSFEKIVLRMRSLCYNLLRAKKIEFTFKADENLNDIKFSLEERRNFYLIFKESLNNLVKYSGAGRVSVSLARSSNRLTLLIRDDGSGFDTDQKYNGNGLINMKKLKHNGSDHFPMFSHFECKPSLKKVQEKPKADAEEMEKAQEKAGQSV